MSQSSEIREVMNPNQQERTASSSKEVWSVKSVRTEVNHTGEWDPAHSTSLESKEGGSDGGVQGERRAKRKCIQELGDKFLAEKLQREWRMTPKPVKEAVAPAKTDATPLHVISRTKRGYMEVNVRRGCCLCSNCGRALSKVGNLCDSRSIQHDVFRPRRRWATSWFKLEHSPGPRSEKTRT